MSRSSLAVVAVFLLAAGGASAQQGEQDTAPAALSVQADLVFQGTVTDITYASSVEGIPHTFVTYNVEDVLKGSYQGRTLTLRFIGGEKVEGGVIRRLTASHAPRFALGQQDVLMVQGNNREQCPLVMCAQGRFRLVEDLVTTEEGLPLVSGTDTENQVASRGFVDHLRQAIRRQSTATAPVAVSSADPSVPFKGPEMLAAPPPREHAIQSESRPAGALSPESERDRQEVEALRRNGGNPVLPDSPR